MQAHEIAGIALMWLGLAIFPGSFVVAVFFRLAWGRNAYLSPLWWRLFDPCLRYGWLVGFLVVFTGAIVRNGGF